MYLLKCDFAPTSKNRKNNNLEQIRKRKTKSEIERFRLEEVNNLICESTFNTSPDLVSLQGRIVNELKISFGQSPAVAHAIAAVVDKTYNQECVLTQPGTVLYSATHVSEPAGKPLILCKKTHINLTIWKPSDDLIKDMKNRRKEVLKRITTQAYDQEGVLTIEDCQRLMLTGVRTLKEYISELKSEGINIPLRGYVHSTGRGQTHKTEIICYYLEGMPLSDIQMRTYHSMEAIARYLSFFSRIVICFVKQNMKLNDIAKVVKVSPDLVKDYINIYKKYADGENERLHIILDPKEFDNYVMPFKKKQEK